MLIYHHLGLGDHFICNGMVRYFYKLYPNISLIVKHHNKDNVARMFKDINIELISVNDDLEACLKYHNTNNKKGIGFMTGEYNLPNESFDQWFYRLANLDINVKFKFGYIERDLKRELEVYKELNIPNDYIFVHHDEKGTPIRKEYLEGKNVVYPLPEYSLYDYIGIIEQAKEVHCMNSSFMNMIDIFNFKTPKLYLHQYCRYPDQLQFHTPKLQSDWNYII